MAVNAKKSHFMIIHQKGKKVDMGGKNIIFDFNDPSSPHDPNLVTVLNRIHNDHADSTFHSIRHLGILLDENLNFKKQAEHLIAKLSRASYMLNRVKHILPKKALVTLYHSLFHCHLTYCSTLLSCYPGQLLDKIVRLQKKVVRIITNAKFSAHTAPIFQSLQIAPVHSLIDKAIIQFMHPIFHKYADLSFIGHWTRYDERTTGYNLREGEDFVLPFTRTEALKKLPFYHFAKIWNEASANKYIRNRQMFQIAFHTDLFPQTN